MLQFIGFAVLLGHYSLLFLLCIYGAHRLQLTWVAWRSRSTQAAKPLDNLPVITVQLPVFNERFVVERLIDAVAALDYPRERLQIQVLDDSTDDTTVLAAARVAHHRAAGIWIEHLHRTDRTGFKAGALGAGLVHAKGEFIAIFDADFVPVPEALKEAIHAFSAPDVGMVQLRWLHLNRHYNTLTEVQAVMLDAHFAIDQVARARTGLYFNFNGTAGLWRKQAIHDAGGWQWDTITEDLDLSYRAQMKGWRFVYLHNIGCPSELPVEMTAFKSQQHRWAQGAIQVMRKTLPRLWRAPLALRIKLEATLHLSSNLAYLLMLIDSAFFLLPSVYVRQHMSTFFGSTFDISLPVLLLDGPLLLLSTGSHLIFFMAGQKPTWRSLGKQLLLVPALLATAVGLSLNNGRAVWKGLRGAVSPFVRTPKLGDHAIHNQGLKARPRSYAQRKRGDEVFELSLAALYGFYTLLAVALGWWGLAPFLMLFMGGFLYAGTQTLRESRALLAEPA